MNRRRPFAPAALAVLVALTVLALAGPGAARRSALVAPVVNGVAPIQGPAGSITKVTVTGSGFTGATGIRFGGRTGTLVQVLSDTRLVAITPAEPGGIVDVTVLGPGGASPADALDIFIFNPTLSAHGTPATTVPATIEPGQTVPAATIPVTTVPKLTVPIITGTTPTTATTTVPRTTVPVTTTVPRTVPATTTTGPAPTGHPGGGSVATILSAEVLGHGRNRTLDVRLQLAESAGGLLLLRDHGAIVLQHSARLEQGANGISVDLPAGARAGKDQLTIIVLTDGSRLRRAYAAIVAVPA